MVDFGQYIMLDILIHRPETGLEIVTIGGLSGKQSIGIWMSC